MNWSQLSVNQIRTRLLTRREPVTEAFLEVLARDPRIGARNLAGVLLRRRQRGPAAIDLFLRRRERELRVKGYRRIVGVDEVGVGPWAGPIVAAAVMFDQDVSVDGVDDSKLLDPETREKLEPEVRGAAAAVALGVVSSEEIDRIGNLYEANRLALRRALDGLPEKPDMALVDGRSPGPLGCPHEAIVKGDRRIFAIAAASIVAKVHRDRLMGEMESLFPGYGFARHKGYGTAEHYRALREKGPSPVHRRSFAPVREAAGELSTAFYEAVESVLRCETPGELSCLATLHSRDEKLDPVERRRLLNHVRLRRGALRSPR